MKKGRIPKSEVNALPGVKTISPSQLNETVYTSLTAKLHARASALGISPFDVLLYFAGGQHQALGYAESDITPRLRFAAASEACKYLFPQLKSIEHKEDTGDETKRSSAASELLDLMETVVRGRAGPTSVN